MNEQIAKRQCAAIMDYIKAEPDTANIDESTIEYMLCDILNDFDTEYFGDESYA